MTRAALLNQIQNLLERVERLEASVHSMPRAMDDSNDPQRANEEAFERAVAELAAGNRKALSNYVKRGGKIPTERGESHGSEH